MIHLILFFRIVKIQFKNVYLIYFQTVYIYYNNSFNFCFSARIYSFFFKYIIAHRLIKNMLNK